MGDPAVPAVGYARTEAGVIREKLVEKLTELEAEHKRITGRENDPFLNGFREATEMVRERERHLFEMYELLTS